MNKFGKKIFSILMILMVATTCIIAKGSSEQNEGKSKTIAGIVFQEDQYFKTLSNGYRKAAEDYGYDLQLANTTNDQSKETNFINTYVAQNIAGLAIAPMNSTVSPAILQDANDAGLKIAICNSVIDQFPYAAAAYTADNYMFCYKTGELAVEFIKKNYDSAQVLQIGLLQFKTQVPEISAQRVNGFLDALKDSSINYEVVSDQDGWLQDMAVGKVGDMLAANPNIDIIFAANGGGAVGAVMAIENAGLKGKTFVFGASASEQLIALLKDDSNILQGITGLDPFTIGYKTVEALVKVIEGKDFEGKGKTNIVPSIPLIRGNNDVLDEYLADMKSKM